MVRNLQSVYYKMSEDPIHEVCNFVLYPPTEYCLKKI